MEDLNLITQSNLQFTNEGETPYIGITILMNGSDLFDLTVTIESPENSYKKMPREI